ncbi:MAG: rhodanese-like domain-containing protein [Proteobacteria bacterium]|jgi:hydroxyacylglutathione hydrolase|nr:rhodanese-like domain-containing protein [Pseudomonadota bacterium]
MGKKVNIDGVPTLMLEAINDVSGFTLVDVRRDDEFTGELGHIQGATLKTLGPDLMKYLNTENKKKPILFICRSGARSANATMMAMDMGFETVFNMQGGMIQWNQLGFSVQR